MTCLIKFEARFIHESDENCPIDALHMYAENESAMKRNEDVLNNLPGDLYTIETDDKILDNCKYPLALIETARNQKPTNTGGLAKLLKLKIGAKVMLTVNMDMQDRLINGQTGNIRHTELVQGTTHKAYVKFSYKTCKSNEMIILFKQIILGFPLKNVKLRFQ